MHAKIKKVSFQIFSSIVFHFLVPCHELARAQQAVKEVAEQAAHLNGEKKMRPWPAESVGITEMNIIKMYIILLIF